MLAGNLSVFGTIIFGGISSTGYSMDRSNTAQGNGQWTTPVNVSQKAGNPRLSAS